MRALWIEIAQLRVAEHRHDVEIVRVRDLQHIVVVRDHRQVPVVKIETFRPNLQMDPRGQQVGHVTRVRAERVQSRFLPWGVERSDDATSLNGWAGGARGLRVLHFEDFRQQPLAIAPEQELSEARLMARQVNASSNRASDWNGHAVEARQKRDGEKADQPYADRHHREEAKQRPNTLDPPPAAVRRVEKYGTIRHGSRA